MERIKEGMGQAGYGKEKGVGVVHPEPGPAFFIGPTDPEPGTGYPRASWNSSFL